MVRRKISADSRDVVCIDNQATVEVRLVTNQS